MIRKAIIVVLTLGAVGGLVLWLTPVLLHSTKTWISLSGPLRIVWNPPSLHMQAKVALGRQVVVQTYLGVFYVKYHTRTTRGKGSLYNRWGAAGFYVGSGVHPQSRYAASTVWSGWWEEKLSSKDARLLDTSERHTREVSIPLWGVCLAFATYPTIAFIRGPMRRWRWRRKGLCTKCGYNLTGNTSGVCPECGTEVKGP